MLQKPTKKKRGEYLEYRSIRNRKEKITKPLDFTLIEKGGLVMLLIVMLIFAGIY